MCTEFLYTHKKTAEVARAVVEKEGRFKVSLVGRDNDMTAQQMRVGVEGIACAFLLSENISGV